MGSPKASTPTRAAAAGKDEGVEHHRHRRAAPEGVAAENRVEGVEKGAAQAQDKARGAYRQAAPPHAADKGTAQEGKAQGQELPLCDGLPPQEGAHNHHKGGGGVQEDGRRGQGAVLLAGEVAQGKKQHADKAGAGTPGQLPQSDAKGGAVRRQQHENQKHKAPGVADEDNVPGGEAGVEEIAAEQADEAPADAGQQDGRLGKVGALLHGVSSQEGKCVYRAGVRFRLTALESMVVSFVVPTGAGSSL